MPAGAPVKSITYGRILEAPDLVANVLPAAPMAEGNAGTDADNHFHVGLFGDRASLTVKI